MIESDDNHFTSIIIPARNAELTLRATLDSLLAQSSVHWEALVIDDASTDGTSAIVDSYATGDARFLLLRSEGRGASAARNVGLREAKGGRLLLLDSDDWISPQFLAVMNEALDGAPDAIAAYCGYCRVMPDGGTTPVRSDPGIAASPFETFARTCGTAIHCVLFDKQVIADVGAFDTSLSTCEDWDFWQRIARLGGKWVHVDACLSYYRASAQSLTHDVTRMLADAEIVIKRGFSQDPRVKTPAAELRHGACQSGGATAERAFAYFALWCDAFNCGRGKPTSLAIDHLANCGDGEDVIDPVAGILFDGAMVGVRASAPAMAARWGEYGADLVALISKIGTALSDQAMARGIQYRLERMILDHDGLTIPRRLSLTLGLPVDLRRPPTVLPPHGVDRLYVRLCDGPRTLMMLDLGVLGAVTPTFWLFTLPEILGRTRVERMLSRRGRLWFTLLRMILRAKLSSPAHSAHAQCLEALKLRPDQAAADPHGNSSHKARNKPTRTRSNESPRDARMIFWDDCFETPDPWNYESAYEQEKYARQLAMLPAEGMERTLELACAEGHFTQYLARRTKTLIAADISQIALQRTRTRCGRFGNVQYLQLDIITDALPDSLDSIVCSEVLYYLQDETELKYVAQKLVKALKPGGSLIMAHAFVLKDNLYRTGFDWENSFGAEVISQVFAATPGLGLKSSLETELYKVDQFVRLRDQDSLPAPLIHAAPIRAKVDLEVARHVVWGGAVARRAQTARDEKREKAPVLLYHSIASTGPDALRQYRVSPELFGAQMRWLRRHGYYTIHSAQLAANIVHGKQWEGRPVLISFDDGFQNFAEEAWPRLQEHDFFAEMFVPTDHVGKCAKWDSRFGPPAQLMDCHTITRLSKEGVFFGSHLASHRASRSLSTGELAAELARSRNALEHWTGRPVNSFAAPYGSTDFRLRQLAAEIGFQTGFSTAPGAAKLADDPLELPRIEVRGDLTLEAFAASMEAQL